MLTTRGALAAAIAAVLAASGCTLNGKPVSWPRGNDGDGGGGGAGGGGGSATAPTTATQPGKIPAWCAVEGVDRLDAHAVKYTLDDDDPRDALYNLAGHFCDPDDESREHWRELEAARVRWSAALQLDDADWRDAVEWALRPQIERNSPSLAVDGKRALAQLDAIEQYALVASSNDDKAYLVDVLDGRLTESGRMAYVEDCLGSDKVGAWAICHGDVRSFSRDKVIAELRAATGRSGYERITVRLAAFALAKKIDARLAAVEQLVESDDAYRTLFSIGEKVRREWAERVAADDPYRQLAFAMDEARRLRSRKAFAGCAELTWTRFRQAVGRIPAERFANLVDEPGRGFAEKAASVALDQPDVYLAANAMIICLGSTDEELDYLERVLSAELMYRPGHRGPRTATHGALLAAGVTPDDRDARIELPAISREWLSRNHGSSGGGQGVVAAVKAGASTSTISFAKEMATYTACTKWKTTNRIDRIDHDGRLHYEQHCVATQKKTYDRASGPQAVASRYLDGVRPGAYVTVVEDVVTGAWREQGAKAPVAVLGVEVGAPQR